ncbi:MAG: helix-turn-helix domain-containing protein [bacterium]|nr:helix-turn-helix domain-containing protein [bacterium]
MAKRALIRRVSALVIPAVWLAQPSPFADAAVYQVAVRTLEAQAERLTGHRYTPALVEELMTYGGQGGRSLEEVARRLAVSSRTLIRRLREAGTTYRALRDVRRRQRALALLSDTALTAAEVAYRLGYEDASNFGKACHRWFGCSPGALRARTRAGRGRPVAAAALVSRLDREQVGAMARAAKTAVKPASGDAARLVDARIRSLGGWRAATLATVRRLIHEADPDVVEACKWAKPSNPQGVPVWSHDGIVCTGEAYAQVVKLTFARGASLDDPRGLFNAGLEGGTRRAIDIREGESLDATAFKRLVRAAVAENGRVRVAKTPGRRCTPGTRGD